MGKGEWKHKPEYRHQSCKLHIDIKAKNLQLRATKLTIDNVSDSQVLGNLLNQILSNERSDSVCTNGAYDTKCCRQVKEVHASVVALNKFTELG